VRADISFEREGAKIFDRITECSEFFGHGLTRIKHGFFTTKTQSAQRAGALGLDANFAENLDRITEWSE
jgi:hypothetical protein